MTQTSFQLHKIMTSRKIHIQKLSQADWFVSPSHSDCFHEIFMNNRHVYIMTRQAESTVQVVSSQRITIHLPQKRFLHNGI